MGETDRIRVPTNGRRPALDALGDETPAPADEPLVDPSGQLDLRIAFTPGQLAAGFGVLAGLILLLVGTRRGRRRRGGR